MLVEILKKIAEETQEELQTYRHRPSSVGKCIRALVYHAQGAAPEPFPGRAIMVFDDSLWHEELTADWLRRSAYELHSRQMEIDIFTIGGKTVKGHIDGIIKDPLGNEYLWEHKAINHFGFERIEKDPAQAEDYSWQCSLYLHSLHKIQPEITKAILHIKNKNTSNYNEFVIDGINDCCSHFEMRDAEENIVFWLDAPVEKAREKFIAIDEHVLKRTLPDRPFGYGDWHCDYCRWGKICWQGYKAEIEAMPAVMLDGDERKEMLIRIAQYNEVQSNKKILNEREKRLKDAFKDALIKLKTNCIGVGNYEIERHMREVKAFQVPARTDEILTVKDVSNESKNANKRTVKSEAITTVG